MFPYQRLQFRVLQVRGLTKLTMNFCKVYLDLHIYLKYGADKELQKITEDNVR